jgi:hypothetical protein
MNPQQFAEFIQTNPLTYPPSMMEGYYSEAPQPLPTWPQIPRVEIPKHMTQKVISAETYSQGQSSTEVVPEHVSERVSERVQKRKQVSQEANDENMFKKLELFEVQIKNLHRVADSLLKRISATEAEQKVQNQAILTLRDSMVNDHSEFRKVIETLARYSMDTRKKLKTHNKILDDFQGLVEAYTHDKMEHYLNERCLLKFNEMADKILAETEMTPEEIEDIAKSLGLDTAEDKGPPPEDEAPLVWNLDDVLALYEGEDRDVQPISG